MVKKRGKAVTGLHAFPIKAKGEGSTRPVRREAKTSVAEQVKVAATLVGPENTFFDQCAHTHIAGVIDYVLHADEKAEAIAR